MSTDYHRLLRRQIKMYFKNTDVAANPELIKFIESINLTNKNNDANRSFENNAFELASKEYEEINRKLKNEKKITQHAFKELLSVLRNSQTLFNKEKLEEGDLLTLTSLVQQEINNRKRVEEELRTAKREAEKSNRSKSDFLSTMSHEIRTPLNVIIGVTHLLNDEPYLDSQEKYLSALRINANNLKLIIDDILDFSKIESGNIELENRSFSLHDLLSNIKEANQLLADDKANRISLKIDDEIPEFLIGDKVRLGQILTNLVSNAVKFTSNGKIDIHARFVDQSNSEVHFEVSVKDSGIGIPEDKQAAIFERFKQVSAFTTREFGGTGLGLAITKKLLEKMGSDIQLESVEGEGSNFYFQIKLKLDSDHPTVSNQQKVTTNGNEQLKVFEVLVVEDAMFNYLVIDNLLQSENINTYHAENGRIAVDMVMENKYDLVLMDVQMPVMNGLEATKEIRKFNTNIQIFALTASSTTEQKNMVYESGMNDFLTKPIDPIEFKNKINQVLNRMST